MAAYVKYNKGTEVLAETANCGSDTWKLILSNTIPNTSTDTTASSAAELPTAGGYTSGGVACSITSSLQISGTYKLILAAPSAPTWTASGPGFTFRYVILYNSTNAQCIGYWDYGSSVVMNGTNGDTFTPTLDAANGTFTIA